MGKVLGLGNALVDIMTRLESDHLLEQFRLPRGSMQLVDRETSDHINQGTLHLPKTIASGGSAANTIHGLASLGIQTGFIGKIGNDDLGSFFREDMQSKGIRPLLHQTSTPTGKAIALVSPDSERTFATYLGAAVEMSPEDLNMNLFRDFDYFHIEGYMVQNHALIEQALKIAKGLGMVISLDLASYNVVEEHLDFLKDIVAQYVDVVFANEEEAKSFTGKKPEEALEMLAGMCSTAVVKTGKSGSIIRQNDHLYMVRAIPAKSLDTTGAGDLYAAGFIYGLIHHFPPEKCGRMGSLLAGKVIEVMGPKLSEEQWSGVKHLMKAL